MIKQIITSLIFAPAFLATAAFGADPLATAASASITLKPQPLAPNQIIYIGQMPSVADLIGDAVEQGLTVKEIIRSIDDLDVTFQARDGQTKSVTYELLQDTSLFLKRAASPTLVFSKAPSTAFLDEDMDRKNSYPSFHQSDWFPSVTFRFDFGRRHQS